MEGGFRGSQVPNHFRPDRNMFVAGGIFILSDPSDPLIKPFHEMPQHQVVVGYTPQGSPGFRQCCRSLLQLIAIPGNIIPVVHFEK